MDNIVGVVFFPERTALTSIMTMQSDANFRRCLLLYGMGGGAVGGVCEKQPA